MFHRVWPALGASAAIAAACSSEPAQPTFRPECTLNQFRACDMDACRGSQQCVDPGIWSSCACVILDANYPEAATDAHDSALDATETGAEAEAEAEAGAEASADGPNDSGPDASD